MWRNLRNVNVGSAMQAIGNVVAPPAAEDDESSYEDEEELEEADDIDSQHEGADVHNYPPPHGASPLKTGLGFVGGMLARALDRQDYEDEYESYEEDEEEEEVVEYYREDEPPRQPTSMLDTDEKKAAPALAPPPENVTPPRRGPTEDDGWDDIHETWQTTTSKPQPPPHPPQVQPTLKSPPLNGAAEKVPIRHSPQREAGSLSPLSPSRKHWQASPDGSRPLALQAMDSSDSAVQKLKDALPQLGATMEKDETNQPSPPPDFHQKTAKRTSHPPDHNVPETETPTLTHIATRAKSSSAASHSTADSSLQRRGESHKEESVRRSSKVSLSDARFLAEPPRSDELETADRWASTSLRNTSRPSLSDSNARHSGRSLDSYFDDSSLSSLSTNEQQRGTRKKPSSPKSKSEHHVRTTTATSLIPTGTTTAEDRFRADTSRGKVSRVPPPEPQRKVSNQQWTRPTQPTPEGDVMPKRPLHRLNSLPEAPQIQTPVENEPTASNGSHAPQHAVEHAELVALRQKCADMQRELEAQRKSRKEFEQKWKEEVAEREAQLVSFQEKEARLFEAATEDREQVARELGDEMERRVGEISALLEDQERQHEQDRAEWQEMLQKAEYELQALRQNDQASAQVQSALAEQEQRHQEERLKWLKSLSEAEKQMELLKASQNINGESSDDTAAAVSNALQEERQKYEEKRAEWQTLLSQTEDQLQVAQEENREILSQLESARAQNQQRQNRAVRMAEDKLAQTLAILDEREEQIAHLKGMVKSMSDEVNDHREGVQEVENEVDELHHHNELLQHRLESKEAECRELHEELSRLHAESEQLVALKMELRMLKEDQQRERAQSQSVAENASTNTAKISTERDAALAEVSSLRQQLAAAQADIEIAQQDAARAQKASENLQMALESMQAERDAELSLLEDQRRAAEEATAAAHAAALEATHEANEARIREVQAEAEARLIETREEMRKLEEKLEAFRVDNAQMRRSLDEAISRLQHNVEDVIDRTLMKNILLDWLTKHGNKEKRQILEMMSSLLHFTDEEKARVHIGGEDFSLGKVVATVAAPPPPSKADVEHLQGANVQEKWVNFLLAETED